MLAAVAAQPVSDGCEVLRRQGRRRFFQHLHKPINLIRSIWISGVSTVSERGRANGIGDQTPTWIKRGDIRIASVFTAK